MTISREVIEYIIDFIIGEENSSRFVCYGETTHSTKPITIIKSGFFEEKYGSIDSKPVLPLVKIDDNIPVLYGSKKTIREKNRTIIYGDIIASAFFLLSLYDELYLNPMKDSHGRPIGRLSFKAEANILERPLVDEYGVFLRKELSRLGIVIKSKKYLNNVYLTHDVDNPWMKGGFISGLKKSAKNLLLYKYFNVKPMINGIGIYKWNALDSFDWMLNQDSKVKNKYGNRAKDIYFIIGVENDSDMTMKYWNDKRTKKILNKIKIHASKCGLHSSYEAGLNPKLTGKEKNNVETVVGKPIVANRNHYLLSNYPKWLDQLIDLGITDDFSVGYADIIGFRLSTCRKVKWIDPVTLKVKNIYLHPLSIMDSTLMESQYMSLDYNKSQEIIKKIIDTIAYFGGDYTFLLHNDTLCDGRYIWMKKLYCWMIDYICCNYNSECDI